MKTSIILGLTAAAALTMPAAADVSTNAAAAERDCFFISQWRGWSAPDQDTLLLELTNKDIYRAELSSGSRSLTASDAHLFSETVGPSTVCSAVDLQLKVSTGGWVREPLIVKSLVKLTPEEVAAIPKKDRP